MIELLINHIMFIYILIAHQTLKSSPGFVAWVAQNAEYICVHYCPLVCVH